MDGQNAKSCPTLRDDGFRGSHTNINLADSLLMASTALTWYTTVDYKGGEKLVQQSHL